MLDACKTISIQGADQLDHSGRLFLYSFDKTGAIPFLRSLITLISTFTYLFANANADALHASCISSSTV